MMNTSTIYRKPTVVIMSSLLTEPAANPFAAPAVPELDRSDLRPYEAFRVVDNQLYCRSTTDLSHTCWLTGETERLVGTQTFRKSAEPRWIFLSLLIPIGIVLSMMIWVSNATVRTSMIFFLVLCTPLALFGVSLLTARKFQLAVGLSAKAQRGRDGEIAAKWFNRLFFVVMVTIGYLSFSNETLPKFGQHATKYPSAESIFFLIVFWVAGAAIIHVLMKPKVFRPHVQRHDGGLFVVDGLTPEFLHSLSRQQHEQQVPSPSIGLAD